MLRRRSVNILYVIFHQLTLPVVFRTLYRGNACSDGPHGADAAVGATDRIPRHTNVGWYLPERRR